MNTWQQRIEDHISCFFRFNDHWLHGGLFTPAFEMNQKWRVTREGPPPLEYWLVTSIIIMKARNRKTTKQRSRECCPCGQDKGTVECSASLCQFFDFCKNRKFWPFGSRYFKEMRKLWTWSVLWPLWKVLEERHLLVAFSNLFESMYIKQSFSPKFPPLIFKWRALRCVGLFFFVELVNLLSQGRQCSRAIHCA